MLGFVLCSASFEGGIEAVRPLAQSALDLGLPERRLDHASDANRDLVLKIENIFEQTVEAVAQRWAPLVASM